MLNISLPSDIKGFKKDELKPCLARFFAIYLLYRNTAKLGGHQPPTFLLRDALAYAVVYYILVPPTSRVGGPADPARPDLRLSNFSDKVRRASSFAAPSSLRQIYGKRVVGEEANFRRARAARRESRGPSRPAGKR